MPEPVTLVSIGDGAALELFDRELTRVIENIADINTPARAKREINIKVTIQPEEDRSICYSSMEVSSKISSVKPVNSVMYLGRDKETERVVAVTENIRQPRLFGETNTTIAPLDLEGGAR